MLTLQQIQAMSDEEVAEYNRETSRLLVKHLLTYAALKFAIYLAIAYALRPRHARKSNSPS